MHLSIDGKSFIKGHKHITILSEPISGIVVEVTEDRDYKSCKNLHKSVFSQEHIGQVKTVCMDTWKSYLNATKDLPHAHKSYMIGFRWYNTLMMHLIRSEGGK